MAYIGSKPADKVLTASDITDGIVSNAKLAQDIISADTALGATPADTDEFLVSDAGTLKRMDYSYIKASNTPAFMAYGSGSNQSISDNVYEKVTVLNTELFDTDSAFASDRFTVPSGQDGKYYIFGTVRVDNGDGAIRNSSSAIYLNGSISILNNYDDQFEAHSRYLTFISIDGLLDLSAGDYVELYNTTNINAGTSEIIANGSTRFGAYKILT